MTIASPSTRPIEGRARLGQSRRDEESRRGRGRVMRAHEFEHQDGKADPGRRRGDLAQRR